MGLDAVVYTSIRKLPAMKTADAVQVNKVTGEASFEDGRGVPLQREDVIAAEKRLGNATRIAALRAEVEDALGYGSSSLLLSKVLYDGTHSGDAIRQEDFDLLKQELSLLEKQENRRSHELSEFLSDMEHLIAVAEQHGNPIVFV